MGRLEPVITVIIEPYSYLIIAGLCAKVYEHENYKGDSHEIMETNHFDFPRNWNDKVSSVKVSIDCTLELFKQYKKSVLLDIVVENNAFLKGSNDKVSSVACTCQSKF